mgnify:CR=1 FL=1|tara:strand:+ start:777 stop:1109 length:333 start_codon:yes stop_codon:yes gene_type:complete
MKYENNLIEYFSAFSNKNIDLLSDMFSDDVELTDWNISVKGKQDVIMANENIFNSVNTIKVTPISFFSNGSSTYLVLICILINEDQTLNVSDVIRFNDEGLIESICAFEM